MRKIISGFFLVLLGVFVVSGCSEDKRETSASLEVEMSQPAELPVLAQNQVAANPFASALSAQEEPAFEPVPDELEPGSSKEEPDVPAGD